MYLIGAPHPHKLDAQILLGRLVSLRERLVTDAEVFQEIIHRYMAIQRPNAIEPAFSALLGLVDEVLPIEKADVLRAAAIATNPINLSARDALHIAIMERYAIPSILSFDKDFDRWPGLVRIHRV